jgi:hypothetical protein
MNLYLVIKTLYPNSKPFKDYVLMDNGQGPFIYEWNLPDTQPTQEELEAYWNGHQQEILDANKPPLSELDILKANQELMQKAIDDIILGGAL